MSFLSTLMKRPESSVIAPDTTPRSAALAKHLARAQAALTEIIRSEREKGVPYFDRTEAVTDPHITPFLNAMRSDGWIPKLSKSGCLAETQPCEACRKPASRFAFLKAGEELRCCVYCDN